MLVRTVVHDHGLLRPARDVGVKNTRVGSSRSIRYPLVRPFRSPFLLALASALAGVRETPRRVSGSVLTYPVGALSHSTTRPAAPRRLAVSLLFQC